MYLLSGNVLFDLTTIVIGIVTVFIVYSKWAFQYWKNRGVPYFEPKLIWGNLCPPYKRILYLGDEITELYKKAKENGWKHLGFYNMTGPLYMPIDLDIIKHIIAKDFSHFVDRGLYVNEKDEPITAHLFFIGGKKWRKLRAKFTPTFTSGKMRTMFNTITECGNQLNSYLVQELTHNEPIDIKNILGNFSTDIIGSCAFGLDCNSFKDPQSPFRQMGRKVFQRTPFQNLKFVISNSFPNFGRFLGVRLLDEEITNFFTKVVADTIDYREKNQVRRNDFLQMLIEIKNDDDGGQAGDGSSLTLDEIVAQSFVFFVAGFETSATTMSFVLYELARNPDIQQKVSDEINRVLNKHNGEVTYDSVNEMKYMSQVIDEALRMYPPASFISRLCVEDYKVPGTNLTIQKGVKVWFPIKAIHYDEEYYPNPHIFDPDRFSDENNYARNQYTYMPFGEGPRMCIGMRFGLLQTKVGILSVLKNFKISINEKTKLPLKLDVNNFMPQVVGGIWLDMEKIDS